ncbi:652_t:CDS:2, partial [Diversispora eburnea]
DTLEFTIELDPSEPNPDLHALFIAFNQQYFLGSLQSVEVRWSNKMTLCAGLCYYQSGGYCSIRLSEPLLKYRTRKDMIETLLHEMIHAYLFITKNNRNHDAHGPEFLEQMKRINEAAGTNVTVYHNFHEEVDHYRTHIWKCDGPCQNKAPYFGIVKRSMNRKPQPADRWWNEHQKSCGGNFVKISEPTPKETKKRNKKITKENKKGMKRRHEIHEIHEIDEINKMDVVNPQIKISKKNQDIKDINKPNGSFDNNENYKVKSNEEASSSSNNSTQFVQCPICGNNTIKSFEINEHLDICILISGK